MPQTQPTTLSVDILIEVVRKGGKIRTGVDIYNAKDRLLLEKDVMVTDVSILENIKQLGCRSIPFNPRKLGGLWDKNNKAIKVPATKPPLPADPADDKQEASPQNKLPSEVEKKILKINEIKQVAEIKHHKAKECVKDVIHKLEESGGELDLVSVSETVKDLYDFVSENDTAFSHLTREIFSYDEYLYNHSINVCIIGIVIMKKFNESFNSVVNNYLNNASFNQFSSGPLQDTIDSFIYYLPDDFHHISMGFFIHDMGKVLLKKEILDKPDQLTPEEFEYVKTHSTEKGPFLLEKNGINNPFFKNITMYHHGRLFPTEPHCYPKEILSAEIAPYVKVCKLADIFDAMTSKRCYKDAFNPVGVVSDIFHKYAEKDPMLQFILHSFVKSVGIHPPGSFVYLTNGQLCYVIESEGPLLLPITDSEGSQLKRAPDLINMAETISLSIDRRRPPVSPVLAYKKLPSCLKTIIQPSIN